MIKIQNGWTKERRAGQDTVRVFEFSSKQEDFEVLKKFCMEEVFATPNEADKVDGYSCLSPGHRYGRIEKTSVPTFYRFYVVEPYCG